MKKQVLTILTFYAFLFNGIAQEIQFGNISKIDFNKTHWTSWKDSHQGIAIDREGNTIIAGGFSGNDVAFDTTHKLSTQRESNAFIAKYNSNNEVLWTKNIGGSLHYLNTFSSETTTSYDFISDVLVDADNNIYILANVDVGVTDVVDFDPDHPNNGSILENYEIDTFLGVYANTSIVLAKYSPDGMLLWLREIKGEASNEGHHLIFDSDDNIIVTGELSGMLASFDLDPVKDHTDNKDIITGNVCALSFIARYNNSGEFIDVKGIGDGWVRGLSIEPTPYGNFYLSGHYSSFSGGLELFKNDPTPYLTRKSDFIRDCGGYKQDIVIAKYNTSGQVQWAKTIHNSLDKQANAIVCDADENVYVTGFFNGSNVDFDIDNTFNYDTKNSSSGGSAFVAKYESVNGNLVWLKTIEGGNSSKGLSLCIKDNNLILAGEIDGNVSMGNISFTSSVPNAFIAILDTDGNWVTAKKIDNTKHSAISNMFIHLNGKIHFIGYEVGGTDSHISTFNMDGIFMGTATTDALSTSNKELKSDKIKVYPNPVTNILHVEGNINIKKLCLYNVLGNLIISNKNTSTINMQNLANGYYILKVTNDKNEIVQMKVLKN